ncbi:cation diffusion facilitator family transporter [Saprospira grandis DSM 2844]|uniref:Cation diffusion facilitator family transporter n=1 Tax=Saprospira grandis DSM 2844 TaxID=694433 RepID=J1I680_9BACT|nr:cation diffusion facilitator family transporter [Saprospira grandis]EJF54275.1 cation diffusion facilitator family transporter [Saprospira grandis DSM 2844]
MSEHHHHGGCGHGHHHHHHHHGDSENMGRAFLINFSFAILELFGGFWTNSVAILSDALHDFGDSLALGIAWGLERYADKGRTKKYSFGHKRYSVLGALITASILVLGSLGILWAAIARFMAPEPSNGLGMLGFAILGMLVNGWAVFSLKGSDSLNAKAVRLHLLEDVMGWLIVFIGSLGIYFFEWYWLDPLMSIVLALYILYNVSKTLGQTFEIFLQATPANIDTDEIKAFLLAEPAILDLHDLHLWTMDGQSHIFSVHLVVDKAHQQLADLLPIKAKLEAGLKEKGLSHVTLAFELEGSPCSLADC